MNQLFLVIIILLILIFILIIYKYNYYEFFSNNEDIVCNKYYKTSCSKDCNPGFIKCAACGLFNCNGFCLINKPRPIPPPLKILKQELIPKIERDIDCPICEPIICPKCPKCPPPCPDINLYIKKCDIKSCPPLPDLDDFILKSQVPKCPICPDISKYILKSKIPKCDPCPRCIDCEGLSKQNSKIGCCINKCPECLPCQPQICLKSNCKKIIYLPNTKQEYYTIEELENIILKSKINFKNSPCYKKIVESNKIKSKCILSEPDAYNSKI